MALTTKCRPRIIQYTHHACIDTVLLSHPYRQQTNTETVLKLLKLAALQQLVTMHDAIFTYEKQPDIQDTKRSNS